MTIMSFIQPYIFYGLPLIFLPVLIHLLNRLRYRAVKWAAIMFLVSATRSSIRRARLRHYLILALRTSALLFLITAMARPIAGGLLGAIAGGAPDTIFLVLDRSASMESAGNGSRSLRENALELFKQGAGMVRGDVRFVLAESAGMRVQEVASPDALAEMSLCRATSSSCDMPALLGKVLEYAVENNCGDMEIWIASDMQAVSWRTQSPEWAGLKDRLGALPQSVKLRVLALERAEAANVSVSLTDVRRIIPASGPSVNLSVKLERYPDLNEHSLPAGFSIGGLRKQEEINLRSRDLWLMRNLALGDGDNAAGWGVVDIPVDGNNSDNRCYFAYGGDVNQISALAASSQDAGRILEIASAPDPKRMKQSCRRIELKDLGNLEWSKLSMLVWQDGSITGGESIIEAFVRSGGSLIMFPHGGRGDGILGFNWGEVESHDGDRGFSVIPLESMEGPLARTGEGKELPVSALKVFRRQPAVYAGAVKELMDTRVYASYQDGKPFLTGGRLGEGYVFICTTLPVAEWSDLAGGTVLVPMLQRILSYGSARLGGARNAGVGMEYGDYRAGEWICVDEQGKDPSVDAGVYRIGGELVALNVPESEFARDTCDETGVSGALEGVDTEFLRSEIGGRDKSTASEIWPLFVILTGIVMLCEASMLAGEFTLNRKVPPGAGRT